MEIWKSLPLSGFEMYDVSSKGRVRRGDRLKKPSKNSYGYLYVTLFSDNHKRKFFLVHRLVCIAFHGHPYDSFLEVNHKNFVRDDNRYENLEWCTSRENKSYSKKHNRFAAGERNGTHTCPDRVSRGERHYSKTSPWKIRRGESHASSKLSREKIDKIKFILTSGGISQQEIGAMFGVSQQTVSLVALGKRDIF